MKNIVMGILAHVDAGKTTLSEAMLYSSGAVGEIGRVDKRNTHLDTHTLERERGITIFSSQAVFDHKETHISLIDTPGHIDFSCETERALSALDYCILVVSAQDGVRPHTKTLFSMLRSRHIPTIIFVNKTDLSKRTRDELLSELKTVLSPNSVSFSCQNAPEFYEEAASTSKALMEEFFENESLSRASIAEAIKRCELIPCLFGAALYSKGVGELLELINEYTLPTEYPSELFGARVYKIARDKAGRRMTLAKITGGALYPKDHIEFTLKTGERISEKCEELRSFSLDRTKPMKEALPGEVVAILGPERTEAGTGIGIEANDETLLSPVLDYRLIMPDGISPYDFYLRLAVLAEEDPALNIRWISEAKEIRLGLMGEIQKEVLASVIRDRLGIDVGFDEGKILYRETVEDEVIGSGHFEPLRHYAEAHILISPMPEGTGIVYAADCPEDTLSLNWQRLILTHLEERRHKGVLTGSPLTDVKLTVIGGRAHLKHTEGGDFRQATYRAVRQGLMKARSVLLEPTFNFELEVPLDNLGRAMTDITNMHGKMDPPEIDGGTAILRGSCPVSTMRGYPTVLRAYTRGEGRISMNVGAYVPAHNTDEVIAKMGYYPELDERNTASSVFCKAGSGYAVPWYEADEKMHARPGTDDFIDNSTEQITVPERARAVKYTGTAAEDKELMRIFEATYGRIAPRVTSERREVKVTPSKKPKRARPTKKLDEYIILDGYNVIFAWDELKRIASGELAHAREYLTRILCNYTAFKRCHGILVFDAYKQKGAEGRCERCGNVDVIYTREGETADAYIERTTHDMARDNIVRVVTSDLEEQNVILGSGGLRVSVREFRREIESTTNEIAELIEGCKVRRSGTRNG